MSLSTVLALLLLAFAVAAAGCGGDNKSDSGSGGSSQSPAQTTEAPKNVNQAVDRCLKAADKIENSDAKRTAQEACKAAKSGNAEKVKDAARRQCLDLAKRIPAGAQRDQAEAACRKGTR